MNKIWSGTRGYVPYINVGQNLANLSRQLKRT